MTNTCGCCSEELGATEERDSLRLVKVALCRSNECNIRKRCTSATAGHCRSLAAMGLDFEAWDVAMHNLGEQRERAEKAEEMRDLLLESVRNLTADLHRYQGLLKEAQGERDVASHAFDDMKVKRDMLAAEVEKMRATYEAAVKWLGWRGTHAEGLFAARLANAVEASIPVGVAIDTATTKRGSHGG